MASSAAEVPSLLIVKTPFSDTTSLEYNELGDRQVSRLEKKRNPADCREQRWKSAGGAGTDGMSHARVPRFSEKSFRLKPVEMYSYRTAIQSDGTQAPFERTPVALRSVKSEKPRIEPLSRGKVDAGGHFC